MPINGHAPLALTSAQLAEIMMRAKTLRRYLRGRYLEIVAAELSGKEIGDGTVSRATISAFNRVQTEQAYAQRIRSAHHRRLAMEDYCSPPMRLH